MTYRESIRKILTLPSLPVEQLSGANILVTGATGLIGSALVDALMSNIGIDFNVYALGRNEQRAKSLFSEYFDNPRFHFFCHDVMTPFATDVPFHFIIHAASNASPSYFVSSPVEIVKSNILGLCNMLDYGKNHGLKRLLYVSSGEIYGEGEGMIIDESYRGSIDHMSPRSSYPISKIAAENLCVAYSKEYGIDTVIARPCHVYGPQFTESDNRVFAQFLRNILNDQDIVLKSSGQQFRSWCYVVDCASALLHILLKGEQGEAYNIVSKDSNVTIKELADIIAKIGNKKVLRYESSPSESAGYNLVEKSVFSAERLKRLGWISLYCIKDGMLETLNSLSIKNRKSSF